ncbi:MAG TPA: ATPase, T2SS/T4P/T4SS family [Burkholderiales bacterium]|nr:ATPase, T2SS/T4P/T4SS family [Burkholderiales bacterium]
MARPEKIRLGEMLVLQKLISQEQLKFALDEQRRSGRKLGRIFVEHGFVTEEQICEGLAKQFDIPYLNLKFLNVASTVARKLPEMHARRHRALLLEERKSTYLVGMSDPSDINAYDEIARVLKRDIDLAVVNEALLLQTLDRVYRRTDEISGLARALEADMGESQAIDLSSLSVGASAEDAPVVRLLQTLFEDATQVNTSDIHIEPQEHRLHVRFRIDGLLILQTEADTKIGAPLVLRLKLMAGLDISEKRLPQDGRFNVRVREQQVDVRISTMPTQYGESVVLRLLNQSAGTKGLDHLGMPPYILERVRAISERSSGMMLVTGPTGSGKTTTLYSALSEINTIDKKIITVEDPVEYRLTGISQVQVNDKIELTFARVLRSVLRHDPDVILVGEMRDQETAQIGLRASITGHLVFSTLHTRDAASTPLRLIDMGAPAYMVSTSLHAVLAQRLLRVICESCAEVQEPNAHEQAWLRSCGEALPANPRFMQGRGCSHCNGTGFRGRRGIYELLEMEPALVDAINRNDPAGFMLAAQEGMKGKTLRSHALSLAAGGQTTVAEVMRVASEVED